MATRTIDLFSGAGGLSLGARLSGMEVALAVETDRHAATTFKQNFRSARLINKKVEETSAEDYSGYEGVEVLMAGPPCQAFSTSNQRTRNDSNPLNNLLFEPARIAQIIQPKWVVVENVPGLDIGSRRKYLEHLTEMLRNIGYTVSVHKLNAVMYGVPQNRTRLFVLAGPKSIEARALESRMEVYQCTVRDAIQDLPSLRVGADVDELPYRSEPHSELSRSLRGSLERCTGHLVTKNNEAVIARYSHIPQSGNWSNIPPTLMQTYRDSSRCHTGIYHRLRYDGPSKVLGNFRKNMLIHPVENRGLSIREAARIQTFPDEFEFSGSIGKRQQQAGNAVPPRLARAVLSIIGDQL